MIDVVIPAYKAHKTIVRCLASIACQTIVNDLNVIIVNDDPDGASYTKQIKPFKSLGLKIKEIRRETNGGPGLARQDGIDAGESEFVTCIDADDTFAGTLALEILLAGITEPVKLQTGEEIPDGFKCASAQFIQLGEDLKHMVPHVNDMVWMFGKLYRRDFLEKYDIRFNTAALAGSRANEDTGFNTIVRLLCDNPAEQIRYMPEIVYYWHHKIDSITRIGDHQYEFDACYIGWTDNMIYACKSARKHRPFSEQISRWEAEVMVRLYFYLVRCHDKKPVFFDQDWEYTKKYYNECYKRIDDQIDDKALAEIYSRQCVAEYGTGGMIDVMPYIGINEFMDQLRNEDYNPDHIKEVWKKMHDDDETAELINNNIACGVMPAEYWK